MLNHEVAMILLILCRDVGVALRLLVKTRPPFRDIRNLRDKMRVVN
jgi:hypothetical protein